MQCGTQCFDLGGILRTAVEVPNLRFFQRTKLTFFRIEVNDVLVHARQLPLRFRGVRA